MKDSWTVFCKEVIDALRDRKTLLTLLLSTVVMGPLMVLVLSVVVGEIESRADRREVWVAGIDRAPELDNYLRRQGMTVKVAPADYEARLHDFSFGEAVIVVPEDFARKQTDGQAPELLVVYDSANRQSAVSVGTNRSLLRGFSREQGALEISLRGVAPGVLEPYDIVERNLADQQSRSTQATGMVPWMVMMAVLFGGLTVALDATAGERERASLEPLLTNPVSPFALVFGKWMAVAFFAMVVAVMSVLSFFPALWFVKNETLLAVFRFGPQEGAMFLLMLLPLASAIAAVLMLTAVHGRTYKEAQARATFALIGFQLVPLVAIADFSGEKPWHLWVPSLAQQTVMLRALRGDPLTWEHIVIPTGVSIVLATACLVVLASRLKTLATR